MNENEQMSFVTESWKAIPRVSRIIPFGYDEDPEDSGRLLPIPLELEALKKAKEYISKKQFSYRELSHWLTQTTGRYISHMGLKKRIQSERYKGRKATTIKRWARRYKEACEKVEKYENSLGAREQPATAD